MSDKPPAVGSEGKHALGGARRPFQAYGRVPDNPGQLLVRKLRLKLPSNASTSSTVRFPTPSFNPEWEEIEDDPWADEDSSFVSSADPRIATDPEDNHAVPQLSRLEDSDDSSALPDISSIPAREQAAANGPQTRQRKRTDSAPSPPPAKRTRTEETRQGYESSGEVTGKNLGNAALA